MCKTSHERLAGRLGLSSSNRAAMCVKPSEGTGDNSWIMRERPCDFLTDHRCTAYEYRPANRRYYPWQR